MIYQLFVLPHIGRLESKKRPMIVIEVTASSNVSLYAITSKHERKSDTVKRHLYKIVDWEQAGLQMQSYIDTEAELIALRHQLRARTPIGRLTARDIDGLVAFLSNKNQ